MRFKKKWKKNRKKLLSFIHLYVVLELLGLILCKTSILCPYFLFNMTGIVILDLLMNSLTSQRLAMIILMWLKKQNERLIHKSWVQLTDFQSQRFSNTWTFRLGTYNTLKRQIMQKRKFCHNLFSFMFFWSLLKN